MFVNELFENIRMGYKDVSRPSKKNYTYGVELEIVVSDEVFDKSDTIDNLIEKYTDGSPNTFLKNYIATKFLDMWIKSKNSTILELIEKFETISKAKKKPNTKIQNKNSKYIISNGKNSNQIEVTDVASFIRSISFSYDFFELSQDKNYLEYLENEVTRMVNNNINSYVSGAKIKYLEDVMEDVINIDRVELDSSVPKGGEVVSDVYDNIYDFFTDLKNAFDIIDKDEYLSTDMTTGLHINIGTWKTNEIYNLDLLKFFLIADTMGILKDFDRIGSDYAVPNINKLKNAIDDLDIKKYTDISKDITAKIISSSDKFDDINLSKLPYDGYIEIRGFGNADYEKRFSDIKSHVLKLVRVLDISQDPNAYKNDYMKKLTKFIGTIDKTDSSGQLSELQKNILKDFVKWGKPANKKAYSFDVESIDDMAKWIHGFIDSSRGNSTYIKKIGETIPLNLPINMMKFVYEKNKTGSYSFQTDFEYAKNLMEMIIHEYYLEEESPKLEKLLKRIFKI